MNRQRRRRSLLRAIALAGVALSAGSARVQAAESQVPLVHLTAVQTSCAQAFPAIPGQQHCYSMGFYDIDVWVFRDRGALAVEARQESPGIGGQGTPLVATTRRGFVPAPAWTGLAAALGAATVGANPGDCNPLLPILGVPPDFPHPVLHARIVWYGKALRTNTLDLGTDFTELCSPELRDLYARLGNLGDSIVEP